MRSTATLRTIRGMKPAHEIAVPLAEGFEEIEFAAIVDVLRRAELSVTIVSLRPGPVRGAHGVTVVADADWSQVDPASFTALVLPGGQPGTRNLAADPRVLDLARKLDSQGRHVAAICAAPTVLHAAGILKGRRATAFPSARASLSGVTVVEDEAVVRDRTVTTSQGPGTAIDFALDLVAQMVGPGRAAEIRSAMIAG